MEDKLHLAESKDYVRIYGDNDEEEVNKNPKIVGGNQPSDQGKAKQEDIQKVRQALD